MTAGLELDALIAEKVMEYDKQAKEDAGKAGYSLDISGMEILIPHYSTDISAAWEVAQTLMSTQWVMRLETWGTENSCEFSKALPDKIARFRVDCIDTAPLAICLAALKAKGITI